MEPEAAAGPRVTWSRDLACWRQGVTGRVMSWGGRWLGKLSERALGRAEDPSGFREASRAHCRLGCPHPRPPQA